MSSFTPTFLARLKELEESIDHAKDELKRLRLVYSKFPDLEVALSYNHRLRVNETIYYTVAVNSLVTDFECYTSDKVVRFSPYMFLHGIKIHSSPYNFYLSADNNKDFLQGHNIGAAVIEKLDALQSERKE